MAKAHTIHAAKTQPREGRHRRSGQHRDSFDRMLIAQAQIEDLPLVTNETLFDAFGITRIW